MTTTVKLVPRQSLYARLIVELTGCTPDEAPLVEGLMRCIYSTLDGLDRARFRREARASLKAARLDPALARETAVSYALLVPERKP